MERLSDTAIEIINELHTERLDYSSEYIPLIDAANSLAAYEDTGLEPEQVMEMKSFTQGGIHKVDDGWKHVLDLLQAEQDGRLVVLPCKVGDVVYGFHGEKTILPMVVKWIETCTNGWCIAVQYAQMAPRFYRFSDFGKTVFLTSEEAEKALEAMKDD